MYKDSHPGESSSLTHVVETMFQNDPSVWHEQPSEGEVAFMSAMQRLATELPELNEDTASIEAYGREIVRAVEIAPGLFENPANTTFVCSLAKRSVRLERGKAGMTPEVYDDEKTFVFNAALLVAGKHSPYFESHRGLFGSEHPISAQAMTRLYDSFTNQQVTADLRRAIDNGLVGSAGAHLRVDMDDENPVILHVVNMATDKSLADMRPELPDGDLIIDGVINQEQIAYDKLHSEYTTGLGRNAAEFLAATGRENFPLAWAEVLEDGSRHLIITLPTAEKILYTDQLRAKSFNEEKRQRELSIVKHEFRHLEGESLLPDHNIFLGISFEEVRAERAAGNRLGYEDAKGFVTIDLHLLAAIDFAHEMDIAVNGGEAPSFWPAVARIVGLNAALEFALVAPASYLFDTRPLQKKVNQYLGGYNGVEERLYTSASPVRRAQIDEQIIAWAEIAKSDPTKPEWLSKRRNMFGLHFVTDKLLAAMAAQVG